jgi:phosphate transport system protein
LASQQAQPIRTAFVHHLEELKAQVEVMAAKVDEALDRSTVVLTTGDLQLARSVIDGDDEIDSMFVSLTERCYDLLSRQSPVASDLRLVVSVLRILSDLERTGDLCLRIVKLAPFQPLLVSNTETFEILKAMASEAQALFRAASRAWATGDLRLAHSLEKKDDALDAHYSRLTAEVMKLNGADSVPLAIQTLAAGRALERIADHSVMIGERLRYMLTGNLESLSKEIGP